MEMEAASLAPQADHRPSLATTASKRNVLDEGLHSSVHHENKRYSFKMEEPSILVSEEDSLNDDDDDDEDFAGTSTGADSFCDASQSSEADEIYLRRGMSFSTDGNLIDFIDFYREEITGGVDIDDSQNSQEEFKFVATPDMIADHAIRQAQEGLLDDLSEDGLEAEINRHLQEEEALRKSKAAQTKIDEASA